MGEQGSDQIQPTTGRKIIKLGRLNYTRRKEQHRLGTDWQYLGVVKTHAGSNHQTQKHNKFLNTAIFNQCAANGLQEFGDNLLVGLLGDVCPNPTNSMVCFVDCQKTKGVP